MNDVVDGVIKAVTIGRTDIVHSVIAACQTGEVSTDGFNVNTLLNSPLTEEGTLLHLACKLNKPDIVRLLLFTGADTCVQNSANKTPLELSTSDSVRQVFNDQLLQCIANSDVGQVCQLLAAGVSVNLQDSETNQNTPLHWAACYGNPEIIECLYNRGADVNAINTSGASPLHDAVLRGHISIIDELLKFGAISSIPVRANLDSKYKGKTPLELSAGLSSEIEKTLNMATQNSHSEKYNEQMHSHSNGDALRDGTADLETASTLTQVPSDLNHPKNTADPNLSNYSNSAMENNSDSQDSKTPQTPNKVLNSQSSVPQSPTTPYVELSGMNLGNSRTPSIDKSHELEEKPSLQYLWPRPQRLIDRNGKPFIVEDSLLVCVYNGAKPDILRESLNVWRNHETSLRTIGLELLLETLTNDTTLMTSHVLCEINRTMFNREESYRISVSQTQVKIQCSDIRGLHSAICTFVQLLTFSQPDGIPPVQIHDHPCLSCRGVLLDMSKGRIPQIDVMKGFIRILSQLKMNQLQLYHRFFIPNDVEQHWQFPYTRSVLLELSHLCEANGIELIPVLDVTSRVTLDDIDELYVTFQQYIACFVSTKCIAVGPRLTNLLIEINEDNFLSLEDAHRFIPVQSNHTLQLCAYVFHDHSNVLSQVPCNTVLAEYGFQSNYDFASHCGAYEENGVPYCVVTGSAAWNSLAGCPEAAVANIHSAAQSAVCHNACGLLISHWSGLSHMTHHSLIWPGILTAAGLAWNSHIDKEFLESKLAELMNKHVFGDAGTVMGQVVVELGRAETYLLKCSRDQSGSDCSDLPAEKGSTLYQLLTTPNKVDIEHLTVDHFQKCIRHIRKCQSELAKASVHDVRSTHSLNELNITIDLMMTSCRLGRQLVSTGKKPNTMPNNTPGLAAINPGISNLTPTTKTDLANRLLSHIETYRNVWLASNLPQGLQDSLIVLSHILKQFVPEQTTPSS